MFSFINIDLAELAKTCYSNVLSVNYFGKRMKDERNFSDCLHCAQTFKAYKEQPRAKLKEQVIKFIKVEVSPPISAGVYLKYQE